MKKHLSPVVAIFAILTFFVAAAGRVEASDPPPVSILGSWISGTTHAKEQGNNRTLIFIAHAEEAGAITLNTVTYGGQSMTKIIDVNVGTTSRVYVTAFRLGETGIVDSNSSGAFIPSWSTTPDNVSYSSVFLSDVNQPVPIGASARNGTTTGATITTSALATANRDLVIDAATCSTSTGSYTVNNGFTEVNEYAMSSSRGVDGYKAATGANETPSVSHSTTTSRQVLIGFVVRARPIRKLTVSASAGGTVTQPGIGDFNYSNGTVVDLNAVPSANYYFVNWTGTAVTAGKVANPNAASTTILVDANYTTPSRRILQ